MKTIAIIFLATLSYIEEPTKKENLFSWQITFNSYAKCQTFFDRYGAHLMNGVIDHARRQYEQELQVDYLACAKVELDANRIAEGNTEPKIIDQRVMYSTGASN
jgi:hypothetical protein|tara:strand:- start:159 stop:470 length:312 start_codon:yes stop_codon:yes gene_type:complete